MFTRTLTRSYALPVTASEAWRYFSDPVALAAASSHAVQVVGAGPGMSVGSTWQERHGAECDFDVVSWRALAVEPGHLITVEGLQAGGRQRATTRIEPTSDGVEIHASLALQPSLRAPGTIVERVLIFAMLATGLGMSIVAEQFDETVHDDLAHFGLGRLVDPDPV